MHYIIESEMLSGYLTTHVKSDLSKINLVTNSFLFSRGRLGWGFLYYIMVFKPLSYSPLGKRRAIYFDNLFWNILKQSVEYLFLGHFNGIRYLYWTVVTSRRSAAFKINYNSWNTASFSCYFRKGLLFKIIVFSKFNDPREVGRYIKTKNKVFCSLFCFCLCSDLLHVGR